MIQQYYELLWLDLFTQAVLGKAIELQDKKIREQFITDYLKKHPIPPRTASERFFGDAKPESDMYPIHQNDKNYCVKCGAEFIPHYFKPLTICDKCHDDLGNL